MTHFPFQASANEHVQADSKPWPLRAKPFVIKKTDWKKKKSLGMQVALNMNTHASAARRPPQARVNIGLEGKCNERIVSPSRASRPRKHQNYQIIPKSKMAVEIGQTANKGKTRVKSQRQ